jgi:hypothetical protein
MLGIIEPGMTEPPVKGIPEQPVGGMAAPM